MRDFGMVRIHCLLAISLPSGILAQTTLNWRDPDATSGNWSGAVNWWNGASAQAPAGNEILRFGNNHQLTMTNNLSGTPSNRYRIYFDAGATSSRTISGSTLNTFYDFGTMRPVIQNDSTALHTLNFPMAVGASYDLEINPVLGNLTIGGTISVPTARKIQVWGNNGNTLTLGAAVSGAGGISIEQNSTVVLSAANTYTGDTLVKAGTLNMTGSIAPTGKLVTSGGGTANWSGTGTIGGYLGAGDGSSGTVNMTAGSVTVGNNVFVGSGAGAGTLNLSGGTLTANNAVLVGGGGYNGTVNNGAAVMTISGSALLTTGTTTGTFRIGSSSSGNTGGAGTLDLNGGTLATNRSITGGTVAGSTFNFNGGTLRATGTSATLSGITNANVRNGGAVIDTNGFNITIGQTLQHSVIGGDNATDGGLTKTGNGTLTLSGANSHTGVTTVSAGTLRITNASALGTTGGGTLVGDAVTGNQPNLQIGSGVHLNGEPLTLQSSAGGGRGYLETASSETGTYTGSITLAGGGVTGLRASGTLNVNGTMGGSSSSLQLRGTGTGTLNSVLSIGATPINKTDTGTWTIHSTGNTWGATTVAVGTLKAGAANALPATTVLTMGQNDANNATLDLNGYSQTVAGLVLNSAGGTKTITSATAAALTVNTASNYSYGGPLSGAGLSLVKQGPATLTLSVANSYAGGTTIQEGTLAIATNGAAAGTGGIQLGNTSGSAAATLRIDNSISPTNALTINAGSSGVKTIATGNVTGPGYNGAITMNDHLTVNLNYTSNVNQTFTLGGAGNLDLTSRTLTLTLAPSNTGNPTSTISISKPIVGTGAIVINGSGASTGTRTVNISGSSNTYSGGTTLSRGTLNWNANSALGSGTVTLNDASTGANGTTLNRNSNGTLNNNIVVANQGSGITTVGGAGAASVIYGGSLTLNKKVTLNAGDPNGTTTFSGAISGTGGILKDGPGTVVISNNNSGFSGTVYIGSGTLDRGVLRVSSPGALGSGTISVFGNNEGKGMIQLTGGITLANEINIANSRSTFNGGGFAHLSSLSGNNTFSGDMTITSSGGSGANIESVAGLLTLSGTLKNEAGTFARPFVLGGAGSGDVTGTLVNGLSYPTAVYKQGAGTWTLSSANTYSGETQVSNGILRLGNDAAAGTSLIRMLGGTLTSVGATPRAIANQLAMETDGSTLGNATDSGPLTLHGAVSLVGLINTERLLNVNAPVTLAGAVSGTSLRGINKAGSSTLTLTGSGDWTGNTTVSGGTFLVSGGASIPSGGNLAATSGGVFRINTSGAVSAPQTSIQTGSTISLEAGTLRTNAISLGGTGSFAWSGGTLEAYSPVGLGSGSDVSAPGGAQVYQGRQITMTGDLITGAGTVLDLGDLYSAGATVYNNIAITGSLTVGAGTELRSLDSPYLLRGSTGGAPADYGTLVLVEALGGIINPANFTFVPPSPDGRAFSEFTGMWVSAGDPDQLPVDTWYLETTPTQILFHYKVSAAIPEPGTAGLLIAGGLLLRLVSRRRHGAKTLALRR